MDDDAESAPSTSPDSDDVVDDVDEEGDEGVLMAWGSYTAHQLRRANALETSSSLAFFVICALA